MLFLVPTPIGNLKDLSFRALQVLNEAAYVLAEELALREIESEFSVRVQRQVAIADNYMVDGVFLHMGSPVAIEIKYIRGARNLTNMIQNEFDKFSKIAPSLKSKVSFLLVAVTESLTPQQKIIRTGNLKVK